MGISVTDLPLPMQEQALRKLAEEENKRTANRKFEWDESPVIERSEKPKNKYRAKKITLALSDGTEHTFDSKHEAEVYKELSLLEQAGEISELKIQQPYELIGKQKLSTGKTERAIAYIADFTYMKDGKLHVVDAKGYKKSTAYSVFSIKRKLMKYVHDIEVEEV